MRLADADLRRLADIALDAAAAAGEMIAAARPTEVDHKSDDGSLASQVVTDVDRRSEAIILDHLAPTRERYELGLLTEERDDDGSRLSADHFWSIDPLDGTLPFIEGVPGSAVSIALVARDGRPLIGVVYDLAEGALWNAIADGGVFRDRRAWDPTMIEPAGMLSVFADRSFVTSPDHDRVMGGIGRIAHRLGFDGVALHGTAGAVMNACGVLANPPACYLKFPAASGGGSLWDFAATACLLAEAGASVGDIQGAPLDLNRADATSMNHCGVLFASDAELATLLRAGLDPPAVAPPADRSRL